MKNCRVSFFLPSVPLNNCLWFEFMFGSEVFKRKINKNKDKNAHRFALSAIRGKLLEIKKGEIERDSLGYYTRERERERERAQQIIK